MQGKCSNYFSSVDNNQIFGSTLFPYLSKPLILVVDSDIDNLELTVKLVSCYGFSVIATHDSELALEIVEEYQPAMILLELMLPNMDGIDFTKCVRSKSNMVPIIALTSLPKDLFYEQAMIAGLNEYIEKPFEFETVESILKHYLCLSSYLF
jgi:two-component system, cell cycle response regulator DivK